MKGYNLEAKGSIMIALHFLPAVLKELLSHIPTIAFKMVDWKSLITDTVPLIKHLNDSVHKEHIKSSLAPLLPDGVSYAETKNTEPLTVHHSELVLQLFFSQLKNHDGIFLDFSRQHFAPDQNGIHFIPNNIIHQFDNHFRESLIELYSGFYHENDELYSKALVKLGLTSSNSEFQMEELKMLFKEQFGHSESKMVTFSMENFQKSFVKLFEFFLKNEIQLKTDFLFLGVYLVTLYSNLHHVGAPINVTQQFLKIFPKENS